MTPTIQVDSSEFQRQLKRLLNASPKAEKAVVRAAAKKVVEYAAGATPPGRGEGKGTLRAGDRKRGEKTMQGDLNHILYGAGPEIYQQFIDIYGGRIDHDWKTKDGRVFLTDTDVAISDIKAFHNSRRTGRGGRVSQAGRNTRDIGRHKAWIRGVVQASEKAAYIKSAIRAVGRACGGWNAAAIKFGARMPAWVTRHGTGEGSASQKTTLAGTTAILGNSVKYVGSFRGIQRRLQYALDRQASAMAKQIPILLKKYGGRDIKL